MPCTEVCAFPLLPGKEPCNLNHDSGRIFAQAGEMVLRVPGMQEMMYGTFVENSTMLQLLVDWDSQSCHLNWRKTDEFVPFSDLIWTIIQDHDLDIFHVDFEPAAKKHAVLSAPVTEMSTFFFEHAPPDDYLNGAARFAQYCHSMEVNGFMDLVAGISYQNLQRQGVKGKAAVVLIGWKSVEDHVRFSETQFHKDNIHLLRRDAKVIETHHVVCRNIKEISM